MLTTLPLLTLLASGLGAQALRHYNIINKCPSSIDLYINGLSEGSIASGASTTRDFGTEWNGYIYTFANGGQTDGSRFARAGFRGKNNHYFIITDPEWLNTGISITPINKAPKGGFCGTAQCNSVDCYTKQNAYKLESAPTSFPAPVAGVPPKTPLYECPDPTKQTGYTVTFCPQGSFPPANPSRNLHPAKDASKCLDVRGAKYANGTPVQIYDCNGTGAQKWVLNRGSTKVRLSGTNYCLDAGSSPHSGVGMKIWQCYDNLPAQKWYFTQDDRVSLEGKGLCLDLKNGVITNSNQVQTWKCTDGNSNQVWHWAA